MKNILRTGALALSAAGALSMAAVPAMAQQHSRSGGGAHFSGARSSGGARYSGGFSGGYRGGSYGYRGGSYGGGYRSGYHYGFRSGFGWGWWAPGIVLSYGAYGGYPCTVWSPYYGTYVQSPYCNYPYYNNYYY